MSDSDARFWAPLVASACALCLYFGDQSDAVPVLLAGALFLIAAGAWVGDE